MLMAIKDILKRSHRFITVIWGLDLIEAGIKISIPLVIGRTIDGVTAQSYHDLWILIGLEAVFWISHTVNIRLDTRVYSNIIETEKGSYYERAIQEGQEISTINARLNLIPVVPQFLEFHLLDVLTTLGYILFALYYLFEHTVFYAFVFALIISALIPVITYRFQNMIAKDNKTIKDKEENHVAVIGKRNFSLFKDYIKQITDLEIHIGNIESKRYCVSGLLQIVLLLAALIVVMRSKPTAGILYATITYVYELNTNTLKLNEHIQTIKGVRQVAKRLYC
jgi:hypothetical protein